MINGLERKTDFPIFSAVTYKNKIYVAGGGGGQQYGVPNYIIALETVTMMEVFRLNTGDDLVEKIYVNEVDDYLIAISEQRMKIYAIDEKGRLNQKSSIDLKYKDDAQTMSSYCENTLALAIEKDLWVYNIKDFNWNKVFEISIDCTINHLNNVGDPDHFFVSTGSKVMVFSVKNSRFINEIPIETKGKGLFILDNKKAGVIFFIVSSHTESKIYVYERLTESLSKYRLLTQSVINRSRITTASIHQDIIIIGDINGSIEIFRFINLRSIKLYSKKIHELPPNNIIIKRMPSTLEDDSLLVFTFGADYKIKITQLNKNLLDKHLNNQPSLYLYLLIVLLLALIVGYYYQNRRSVLGEPLK